MNLNTILQFMTPTLVLGFFTLFIKHQYAAQLFIHQTRYQNEYTLLKELSEKFIDLRESTLGLRPHRNVLSDAELNQKRMEKYYETAISFLKFYEESKPFYPEDIY